MYLFTIFLISHCSSILSIDLGTEFYKMAESTINGNPQIVLNSNSAVSTPCAIAFRSSQIISRQIFPEDVFKHPIKFGSEALPLLKKNSSLGFQYLNRVLGREGKTIFHTSNITNISQLIAISLYEYTNKKPSSDGLIFVIPQFWTNEQRRAISTVCEIGKLEINTIIEDFTAAVVLYGATRNNKFRNEARTILFIDVGATSAKVYSAKMIWDDSKMSVSARQKSYVWSEKTGGYFFEKALSNSEGISMKKARKLLQSSRYSEYVHLFQKELDELKFIIQKAINLTEEKGATIDEVQAIGGASLYKFVIESILEVTHFPTLSRDFNANEALALGGILAAQQTQGMGSYPYVYVTRIPIFNIYAKCGQSMHYCTKYKQCEDILISNSTGCNIINLYSPAEDIPEGTTQVMAEYELTNISKVMFEDEITPHGLISMKPPDALIDSVLWCTSIDKCYDIEAVPYFGKMKELDESRRWVNSYFDLIKSKQRKAKLLNQVEKKLKLLKDLLKPEGIESNDAKSLEDIFPVPKPYRRVYIDRYNEYYSGKMHNWDEGEITGALEDIDEVSKSIRDQL